MLKSATRRYNKMADEKLLSCFCKGDQQAFEELYSRHCDSLYRFILRQCNHQVALTEEIFQDVWMSIIKSSAQFREESKFSTYLYRIARNRVIDHARQAITHHLDSHTDNIDTLENPETHQPDHKVQFELCIELLQKYIQQLPDEQREAFVLKQETSHSLTELADILHTSLETLKSRLRYAINKLREWLPGECL